MTYDKFFLKEIFDKVLKTWVLVSFINKGLVGVNDCDSVSKKIDGDIFFLKVGEKNND